MGGSVGGPDVVAVVVAHASRTRLRETLRSLRAQTFGRGRDAAGTLEVIVAAVGELEVPQDRELARARVVRVDEPAGFADVVQAALDLVPGATFALLLHDDVSLEPDAIAELVRLATTDDQIAAVGTKLVEWDRPEVLQEVGASIDRYAIRRSALDAGEVDAGQRDDTTDVLFCSDACLLVRRSALDDIGGLDGGAWPFYEDVDLCWRLRARGYRVVVASSARARHAADLSRGRRLFDSTTMREHLERGRLRFMLKHYAPIGLAVLLPQIVLATLVRVGAAIARRELWRIRVIFNSWMLVLGELPSLLAARRRAGPARVDDRELLALAGRSAVADVRGERAEWASSFLAGLGRLGDRLLSLSRQPVAWGWAAAGLVLILMLRNVLFSGTFALGELRLPPTLSDAVSDHLRRVRTDGLDPFGPGTPGLLFVSVVRSIVRSAALAEKVLLLLPLWLAGTSGRRLGRTLGLRGDGPGWLAIVAAVNPVTLSLIRDGALGPLALWAASLWVAAGLLAPAPVGEGVPAVVRFVARWGLGWAVVVALHPPALVWLGVLGAVVVAACRDDNRTDDRIRILATGAIGSFALLLPWSLEWITRRTPLIGRPGWLVDDGAGGIGHASLGAGWPLLGWVLLAIAASFFVGQTRTTFALVSLASVGVLTSAGGLFARETMLAVTGASALLVIAAVVRRIADDLPSYELGGRHAAVIGGLVAMGVLWLGGVVLNVGPGTRAKTLPAVATKPADTGRVLWLAETTGGVRTWETLGFAERLGAFPPPGGPAERFVTRGLEAARAERTHRLGGLLALADISHIVTLDAASRHGLEGQADIAQQESQRDAVVYQNEAWRGPAMLLASPPSDPLSPQGLADVVRDPRRVRVDGWPYGPVVVDPPRSRERGAQQVLYLASGVRGGVRIEAGGGKLAAAGAFLPAEGLDEPFRVDTPGWWWRWLVPVALVALLVLLAAWFAAAYVGGPPLPSAELLPDLKPIGPPRWAIVAVPLSVLFGAAIGWFGTAWGVGGPFLSSAWYCPPIGSEYKQSIAIVNPQDDDVEYIVRPDLIAPPGAEGRISGKSRTTLDVRASDGAVVESYGRRLAVATQVERLGDRDATLCTRAARELNVFPEGGRFATRAQPRLFERYVLYNPFPDLARASVKFYTPERPIAPPRLQDVQVKPGTYVLIDPEAQDQPYSNLSTVVTVWQGRAIVARRLRTVEQVSFSLPTNLVSSGVLTRAQTDKADTAVVAVNTAEEPARVSVFGAARRGSIPEESFTVIAGGRNTLELDDVAPRAAELVVELKSDRPLHLETLVAPDDRRRGVSLLPPVTPERSWVLPIAERRELIVVNPNPKAIRVEVERLGPGEPVETFTVEPSRTARVKLSGSRGFGLIVRSRDGAFTAAAVGGRGSLNGLPFS
jgi:GT2 family glycosyltransferase